MNISILQGPNMNLLGLQSSDRKQILTTDKLNRAIKVHIRTKDIKVKILQTHKEFQALNFLQRNRNWANGLIFFPTSWAKNNFTILETLNILKIKTASIYFNDTFSFGTSEKESILKSKNIKSFTGDPIAACLEGLDYIST